LAFSPDTEALNSQKHEGMETKMITMRKSADRGHVNLGWLDTRHSFSFGHYHDPAHMGFSDLRVINQDRVAAGRGFDTHGHADMEIITYVLRGSVEHRDDLGVAATIQPGTVQRMSAGTGIRHSERNPSPHTETEFLQIWILPEARGMVPSYEQKDFGSTNSDGLLQLVASRDGRDGSITVHQDVNLYRGLMRSGEAVVHSVGARNVWVQLVSGGLDVGGVVMAAGDGATIGSVAEIAITATDDAEFLLFDLRGRPAK
jgi:quercetin 2,3-dioxygenase